MKQVNDITAGEKLKTQKYPQDIQLIEQEKIVI